MMARCDPASGCPLHADGPDALASGDARWPVVEGIPFLRAGREDLARRALAAIDAGDRPAALIALLADQDDFAPTPDPDSDAIGRVVDAVDAGGINLREAMAGLGFGPVAHYFAHRTSTPTYLSGLNLLDRAGVAVDLALEIACGIGQFLRELNARDVPTAGVDVVFAKLWLARRFVVGPDVDLICADICKGMPIQPEGRVLAFCHDAFYFLPDKEAVAGSLRRIAARGGRVLIGHAHNARFDHGGVSGTPRTPEGYAELFPDADLFDDAELARCFLGAGPAPIRAPGELAGVEAVALAWPGGGRGEWLDFAGPPAGTSLRLNPLLGVGPEGKLRPEWPDDRFAREYISATYLIGEPMPSAATLAAGLAGDLDDPEVDRLARVRVLVDLPERW